MHDRETLLELKAIAIYRLASEATKQRIKDAQLQHDRVQAEREHLKQLAN
jgi:hypothetical protein